MKYNYKSFNKILSACLLLCLLSFSSCKKFVDVQAPTTSTNEENVYTSDGTAIAVLTGIYSKLGDQFSIAGGKSGISFLAGLSADEFTLYSGAVGSTDEVYYKNALYVANGNSAGAETWQPLYNYIYKCNSAIEGLTGNDKLTPSVQKQLLGEAKFLRAFFYFYLTNLYGDLPLVTTTDYTATVHIAKSSNADIFKQIETDLLAAQQLLSTDFLNGSLQSGNTERVRPTKWAAIALLARTYLFMGKYVEAEQLASMMINNSSLFALSSLNNVFFKAGSGNKEAIWQLQPVTMGRNTEDARLFVIPATGLSNDNPIYLSDQLMNSFENGDDRKKEGNWINRITVNSNTYYYPFKYKLNLDDNSVTSPSAITEYVMVLRLAEQYLIRAEARAKQGNVTGAVADLNILRTRARATPTISIPNPLPNLSASLTQAQVIDAIMQERRVELFSEWGHRWLDLKRTGKVDEIMSIVTPLKSGGSPWHSYQQWYPIPPGEIRKNPNLTQNTGY